MANIDPGQVKWNDAPAAPSSAPVPVPKAANGTDIDPSAIKWLGAIAQGVQNKGRVTADQQSGHHHPPVQKLGQLSFTHQAILAAMDNKEEKKAFLEKEFGPGSVSEDKRGMLVKGKDGKMMRASSGFWANMVAEAPETVLGIAGAAEGVAAGAIAGPAGAFVGGVGGAMAGAAAGKTIKEGAKAATGTYRKTPGQYARGVAGAAEGGAMAEIGGRVAGPVLSRLTRGPLPKFIKGETSTETQDMVRRQTAAGAMPPALSSMPKARAIQRAALRADKLSGTSERIDRANKGYLYQLADKILHKNGVTKFGTKQSIISRMEGEHAALSTQQTGQMIQSSAQHMLQQFRASNLTPTGGTVKGISYLKRLVTEAKTPEDAYNWLVRPKQTDRLEKFVRLMGPKSQVVGAMQQQALRHAFAGAMEEISENRGMTGLTKWMDQFTEKQQKLLFPRGLDQDLRLLDKEIKFLYPRITDPSMTGMTTGAMMEKKFYVRWYHQGVGGLYRAFLQHPAIVNRLAVGFRGTSAQRTAAKAALKEMYYFGAIEASEPGDPQQQHHQPLR